MLHGDDDMEVTEDVGARPPSPIRLSESQSKGKEAAVLLPTRDNAASEEVLPWVEKYRPAQIDELIAHQDMIATLTRFIDENKLPHLLFYGPPGTGKTSLILACARRLYGPRFRSMILELNASDDRGIDVVREQIKNFASTKKIFSSGFKLIILDEADAMTQVAQNALRRIVEKYTMNVRFCIICNYVSKIIPALQSRCTKFRFKPLKAEDIESRLNFVATSEGVNLTEDGKRAILRLSSGDMRRTLNILQAVHAAYDVVDETSVYSCVAAPLPREIMKIAEWMFNEDFGVALSRVSNLKLQKGLALSEIITELHNTVGAMELPPHVRAYLLDKLAEIEMCYVKSAPVFNHHHPQQQQQQQQQQHVHVSQDLFRQQQQQQAGYPVQQKPASFSFPDLSLDGAWLNTDVEGVLGNPFALLNESPGAESMEFGLTLGNTEDFLPWLESITGPVTVPATQQQPRDQQQPQSVSPQVIQPAPAPSAAAAVHPQQKSFPSPTSSSPEMMVKQDPSVSPYLPSPTSGFAPSETSFPSLAAQGPAAPRPALVVVPPAFPPAPAAAAAPAKAILPAPSKAPVAAAAPAKPPAAPAKAKASKQQKKVEAVAPAVVAPKKRPAGDDSEDDDVVMKRMKNTEAARRSRARKLARLESLEAEVNTLEHDKAALLVRLAVLESEQATFNQREADLNKRINQLELQLAESHRAMVLGMQR
ncbi:hypothetical protein HDU96_003589 [Phlyctochytrium bullatum]|nr:hypothetical protein HDU96_003589 [Phlyctochytrium bullatum]